MTDAKADALREHDQILRDGDHLFSQLTMRDVEVDGFDIAIELAHEPRLANPRGALQGGLVATLADIVAGRAAIIGLEASKGAVTSDLSIHYLAPILTGPAHATAKVLRRGRRSVVVDVKIYDGRGGTLAATSTCAFTVVNMPVLDAASRES